MSILVAIVSHPQSASNRVSPRQAFGFRALKPAIAIYPQFLEMLVSRLSSADYGLCANALQLINSLMRDAITNDTEAEWPKFIKRLQDLGVIKAVYVSGSSLIWEVMANRRSGSYAGFSFTRPSATTTRVPSTDEGATEKMAGDWSGLGETRTSTSAEGNTPGK